ncbi:MAG TPA: hypothetical protein VN699_10380 [Pirellulales bacterium]|nr:hypothetical protein [Pirellulales bacterium]
MPSSPQKHDPSRKPLPPLADFDDQLWPINLVLLVLAGCITGIIVAKSDFRTPVIFQNGWFHLATLAGIVGVLLWGIVKFGARMQRRVQLGVFISLLVHCWLCMVSYNVYLSMVAQREPDAAEQFEEPQIVTLPDYHRQDPEHDAMADEAIESPVETELPEAETQPVEQARPEPTPIERPSEVEPAAPEREPSPVEMERTELTTPHRSEQLSGKRISRSESQTRTPAEQIDAPAIADAPSQRPAMNAQVEAVERQATRANVERREAAAPAAQPSPDRAQIDQAQLDRRHAPAQPSASTSASPAPARQMAEAPSAIPTRVAAPAEAPAAQRPSPNALAPAAMDVARQTPSRDVARPNSSAEPASETRPDVASAAPRRQERAAQPRLDRIAAARSRQTAEAAPAATVPLETRAPGESAPLTPSMAPSTADLARTASGAPAAQGRPEMADPAAGKPARPSVEPLAPARTAAEPTATPSAPASAPQLARSKSAATADSESVAVDSPAASQSQSANPLDSPAQPVATGLTKASGGATGVTRQRNFDRELPGEGRLARTPSAAARRAAASQQTEAGSAASPSEPARIAKARAGAQAPTAALPAEDVTVADAAGSSRPSRIEASSSAALQRAAANAPRGRITAAAGAAPVDLSTPEIVSTIGEGRASGGGEPALGDTRAQARIAKSAPAGAPTSAAAKASAAGAMVPAPATPSRSSSGPAGDPETPAVAALARGQQGLPAARPTANPNSSNPSIASAGNVGPRTLADHPPGQPRRAEDVPAAVSAGGATGGGLARAQSAAVAPGGAEVVELPPSMAEGVAAASAAAPGRGQPAARDGPQEPTIAGAADGAARRAASLPVNSALPGGAGDSAAASGVGPAAPSLGGSAAPRRADTAPAASSAPASASGGALSKSNAAGPAMLAGAAEVEASAIDPVSPSDGQADSPSDGLSAGDPLDRAADLPAGRLASTGVPVRIAAPAGPGGLSSQPAADIGLPSRRARPESEVVHTAASRIILERSGGKLAADVRVHDTAVPGLRQRDRAMRQELARQRGGSESSERAVEMGLDFLARHQNPDGSWSLHDFSQGQPGYQAAGFGRMQSDTAATGLSMLAFLGAGYTHTDGKYRLVVGRGLGYLVGNQREDGDLFLPQDAKSNLNVWLYSHGIASIALCEAYGMTRDPALHDPAQRALDFIVAAQNPGEGGWRYSPRQGSDTSVSGWQLMALKSGELAGLRAPAETYRRVQSWLDGAQAPKNPALYVYRPKAVQDHQRLPSRVMTAEGLLMRQYLGWKRDNPNMPAGADYLQGDLPQWDAAGQRDAYYWYYATQVMFQIGGEHWQQWNDRLRSLLIERQVSEGILAGSWDPLGPSPDRWGREAGRLYVTAMHLLMLEVYYRHLPLYRNLEGEGDLE